MSQVVPKEGAVRWLARSLIGWTPAAGDLSLRLYKNDYTPDFNSTLSSFSECDFDGYFRRAVDPDLWNTPTVLGVGAEIVYSVDPLSWNVHAGGQTVYGHFVIESSTAKVMLAERWATPRVLVAGGVLDLTFRVTAVSQP